MKDLYLFTFSGGNFFVFLQIRNNFNFYKNEAKGNVLKCSKNNDTEIK